MRANLALAGVLYHLAVDMDTRHDAPLCDSLQVCQALPLQCSDEVLTAGGFCMAAAQI